MEFHITTASLVTIIRLKGEMIGGPDATRLSEIIQEYLAQKKRHFLLDLGEVDWMNSSGLGILIAAVTTVRNRGGELKLLRVGPKPRQLLHITHLDRVFEIFEDEGKAIASF